MAFREFIRDSANRNEEGLPWKPAVILNELWNLWKERPEEPGHRRPFDDRHYPAIERLRGNGKKHAVDDGQLFALLRRFLEARQIAIPHPVLIRSINETLNTLLFPPSTNLPAYSENNSKSLIKVYEIGLYQKEKDRQSTLDAFLALRLSDAERRGSCPAILFERNFLVLSLGIYLFASKECHVRNTDLGSHTYHKLVLDQSVDPPDSWPHDENRVYRLIKGDNEYSALHEELLGYDEQIRYGCSESTNVSAAAFAEKYFSRFDI